jgi:hypothetical protein
MFCQLLDIAYDSWGPVHYCSRGDYFNIASYATIRMSTCDTVENNNNSILCSLLRSPRRHLAKIDDPWVVYIRVCGPFVKMTIAKEIIFYFLRMNFCLYIMAS